MLLFIILSALVIGDVIAFVITTSILSRNNKVLRIPTTIFVFSIGFFVLTLLFTVQLVSKVEYGRQLTHRPSVMGEIVESRIVGERAFRPDIRFKYTVEGKHYTGETNLGVPGFGGRINRLDAAEKLVDEYPPGKPVLVYYAPQDPDISALHVGVSYSTYLKLSTTALVLLISFFIMLIYLRFNFTRTDT